jgi:hypothetical protein
MTLLLASRTNYDIATQNRQRRRLLSLLEKTSSPLLHMALHNAQLPSAQAQDKETQEELLRCVLLHFPDKF